jgi:hypothetical protein
MEQKRLAAAATELLSDMKLELCFRLDQYSSSGWL